MAGSPSSDAADALQMSAPRAPQADPWRRLDEAAFGLIYGTVVSLSVLMAMGAHPDHPFAMAAALFGAVLAVTLAEAFAHAMSHELQREREAPKATLRDAWRHARPTLVAANVPTLLILAAGFGLLPAERAIALAQGFGAVLLLVLGGRVGWVARHSPRAAMWGAVLAGGIGVALAALKYALH
jgi:hypothetical protein